MSTEVTVRGRCSSVITIGATGATSSLQTLSFDSAGQLLSISDGNTVSLNHFLTTGEADGRYVTGNSLSFDTGTQELSILDGNSVSLNLFLTTGEADGRYISGNSVFSNEVTGTYNNLYVDKIAAQKIANVNLGILGSGDLIIDLSSGDFFYGIQTGNLEISITGSYPAVAGFEVDLLMSGAGSYTVTLPASFQSLSATAPTIHSETGKHNVFVNHTTNSGVSWLYALGGGSA